MEDNIYDNYVQLTFHPEKKLTIPQVIDIFEEQAHLVLLYHRLYSDGLKGWQCCCAFTKPCFKRMYKFNAMANDDGLVDTITVFIFECMVYMRGRLAFELHEHHKAGGMIYELSDKDLIKQFL